MPVLYLQVNESYPDFSTSNSDDDSAFGIVLSQEEIDEWLIVEKRFQQFKDKFGSHYRTMRAVMQQTEDVAKEARDKLRHRIDDEMLESLAESIRLE